MSTRKIAHFGRPPSLRPIPKLEKSKTDVSMVNVPPEVASKAEPIDVRVILLTKTDPAVDGVKAAPQLARCIKY